MTLRQALAPLLIALFFLCGATAGMAATTRATALPICKAGQKSTKATPCRTVTLGSPQPATNFITDPGDTGNRVESTDAVTVIHFLDPQRGLYQIEVENMSEIGYINTFNWVPPTGMTITSVTSSEGGRCHLAGGMISCTGGDKGIAPPDCTCHVGGRLTVNFTATGNAPTFNGQWWTYYGVVGGYTQITSMTPVPYHIPSYVAPSDGGDVPVCAKGQVSTKASPCAAR